MAAVVHVDVETTADGWLDVHWVLDGEPAAVDVATGPTPATIDHDHQATVAAGITTAVVAAGSGRTFVSVAPNLGGPAAIGADRRVGFEVATNFRDLGGYPTREGGRTRWGQVFRADALHGLTDADVALYESLGIRAVFDLRSEPERAARPNSMESTWIPLLSALGATTRSENEGRSDDEGPADEVFLPITTAAEGEAVLRRLYTGLVEDAAPTIGELLAGFAAPTSTPAVFHCHAGKDRTGIVAAVLLLALGVDRDVVLDDYELTRRYRDPSARSETFDRLVGWGVAPEAAAAVVDPQRGAMAAALDVVEGTDGGVDGWLLGPAGMTAGAIAALRTHLVTPTGA